MINRKAVEASFKAYLLLKGASEEAINQLFEKNPDQMAVIVEDIIHATGFEAEGSWNLDWKITKEETEKSEGNV